MILPRVRDWLPTVNEVIVDLENIDPGLFNILSALNLSKDMLAQIVLGIIQRESFPPGNTQSIGDNGRSFGLMQFNYGIRAGSTTDELNYPDQIPGGGYVWKRVTSGPQLLDPYTGIAVGTRYFLKMLNRYKNVNTALLAYNAGPGNTDKWVNGQITTPVNQSYLDFILDALEVPARYFVDLVSKKKAPILGLLLTTVTGWWLWRKFQTSGKHS